MCLIIYSPNGKIPTTHLCEGLASNPHGWGFMVATGRKIWICKGLYEEDFWPEWLHKPRGPVVWHTRIGTHGKRSIENCHPFRIPGHGHLAIAHNGMIHELPRDKEKSDTRVFIDTILAKMPRGFLENPAICTMIETYIGHSKLVFLNAQGETTILNERLGHWRNKRWYSNRSYVPSPVVAKTPPDRFFDLLDSDRRLPAYYTRLVRPELH